MAVSCLVSDLTVESTNAVNCSGAHLGSDSTSSINNLFAGNWTLFGRAVDDNDDSYIEVDIGRSSGEWEVEDLTSGTFVVALKAGDYYSTYLFSGVDFSDEIEGDFTTIGVAINHSGRGRRGIRGERLDHLSIYTLLTAVPLPGAFVLFGSAFIGLLGISWRYKNKVKLA